MNILGTSIAVITAEKLALRYAPRLRVRNGEMIRYLLKCLNLPACYAGFSPHPCHRKQAIAAGRAAFLSCSFDVTTDWPNRKGPKWRGIFKRLLECEAGTEPAKVMAISLFDKDSE